MLQRDVFFPAFQSMSVLEKGEKRCLMQLLFSPKSVAPIFYYFSDSVALRERELKHILCYVLFFLIFFSEGVSGILQAVFSSVQALNHNYTFFKKHLLWPKSFSRNLSHLFLCQITFLSTDLMKSQPTQEVVFSFLQESFSACCNICLWLWKG